MQGEITALSVQKKNKERVNVYLNGAYAFAITMDAALNLKKGQILDEADVAQLQAQDQIDKAYQRALSYLSYRPRTRREVKQYLHKKGMTDDVIDSVVERLKSANYLDDAEFGRMWAENRALHNPKGRRALQYELRQKGLSQQEIEESLSELDEEALAWQAVQKRLSLWQTLDEIAFKRKLTGYLARRGFPYDIIETIFHRAMEGGNR